MHTYSWRVDCTGTITHVLVELASNQSRGETKSAGRGRLAVNWYLYRGEDIPQAGGTDPDLPDTMRYPSRPRRLVASGVAVHDRGPEGFDGDRRKLHKLDVDNVFVEKGEYLHLGWLNRHRDPTENFISLNAPSTLGGEDTNSSPPWRGEPARRLSVHGGDHRTFVLRERPDGSFIRRFQFLPQISYLYSDGLKLGDAYRLGHKTLRTQGQVGGRRRLRQRWRHVNDEMDCRYAWIFCHWPAPAGRPTMPLVVRVTEAPRGGDPGWSRTATIAPSTVRDGSDTSPDRVLCWSERQDGTFAWWSRADFSDERPLRFMEGRVYTVELSSETVEERPYVVHPIQMGLTLGPRDEGIASGANLWRDDPENPGGPSYAERWGFVVGRWRTLLMPWDRPGVVRRDVSLPIWFERS